MTVAAMLADKGREVTTITAAKSIADAVAVLAKHKIGALVVVEGGDRIIGIISERDIVRAIAAGAGAALIEPVSSIMTRTVVTCSETDTISEIMERMTQGRFRHIPVVEQERLVGIVSIGDVVKHRLNEMERDAEALRDYIQTA